MREENLATWGREMGNNEFSWSGLNKTLTISWHMQLRFLRLLHSTCLAQVTFLNFKSS